MNKHILTQADLDQNPLLKKMGFEVGREVLLVPSEETNNNEEDNEDDPGGGNHPKKPGNP